MTSTSVDAPPGLEVVVLDVGHGSCIFISTPTATALVDTGPNGAILEFLRERGLTYIDVVVISHADHDHIGGLSALLSNGIGIGRVIWNSDGMKRTDAWLSLAYQLDDLAESGQTIADDEAAKGMDISELGPRVAIEVHAPRLRLRRLGVGGRDKSGSHISSNSMSVVVRVTVDGEPLIVIPGDLDSVGLSHLSDTSTLDLQAPYLVLPHHGGLMGTPAATPAAIEHLVRAVDPTVVFISNGRTARWDNPRDDVLMAVRRAKPELPIVCSQLSKSCSAAAQPRTIAPEAYSAGWRNGSSCAGTIKLTPQSGIGHTFDRSEHSRFIASLPTPRCIAAHRHAL
ncbi:ComEC/Rec2 family competence protein [Microbacterium sp. YJN-G]|uniref:ComEC/Rec2 family competence protein n=1 Tax=Microbacterium sp. YJN-G TaxID=2763257 RepID=UPI00187763BC|nr:MBL fold metallo-hydrolase [Microbacterium sp. YJN-G]